MATAMANVAASRIARDPPPNPAYRSAPAGGEATRRLWRQVDQVDVGRSQEGLCRANGLPRVDGVGVQGDHQGTCPPPVGRRLRGATGDLPEEVHQALRVDRARLVDRQAL